MVRQAREQDLPRIMAIYDTARRYMRTNGNTVQWVNGYPSEALLRQDIRDGVLYVMEDGDGVYAVFAFIIGDDPTYGHIEGAWRDGSPYGTIHRLGSDGTHRDEKYDQVFDKSIHNNLSELIESCNYYTTLFPGFQEKTRLKVKIYLL